MKLLRHGLSGAEKPGLFHSDGTIRDLTGLVPDISGYVLSDAGIAMLRGIDASTLPSVPPGTRLGPCVAGTGKFICIGLNYSDHAAETGATVPPDPIIFMKATSAICGPNDPIIIPRGSEKTDWEVELAVIIGTRAARVTRENAIKHVFGYSVMIDVSARDNRRSGQWIFSKGMDSYAPFGPVIVTADEIPDPQNLDLWLTVNGVEKQRSNTAKMLFKVDELIADISQGITLEPGDIIASGTPEGVGAGRDPQEFMWPGDTIVACVEGIGQLRHPVVNSTPD
jgi:2-keto-4-pentenoate hydratase/2-oxohepta-3-ene-1,7-dioic acid hydratase in catechol pathway